ncbi:retinol dehydrogenase 8-like [Glandiceps talaboti]
MAQKIVVITGCSSGIGLAAAALLGNHESKQYKVFPTMRNLGKKEALENAVGDNLNKTAFIRELDVSKDESVKSFFSTLLEEEGRVDILINNAAICTDTPTEAVPIDLFRRIMETNYLGVVRTVQEVIPGMKERRAGRIINISSDSGIIGCPFLDAYCSSKFAVEGLSQCMAAVLRNFNVHVSTIQYGPVHTAAWDNAVALTSNFDIKKLDSLSQKLFNQYEEARKKVYADFGISPEDSVKIILEVIEADPPKFMYQPQDWVKEYMKTNMQDTTGEATIAEMMKTFDT